MASHTLAHRSRSQHRRKLQALACPHLCVTCGRPFDHPRGSLDYTCERFRCQPCYDLQVAREERSR